MIGKYEIFSIITFWITLFFVFGSLIFCFILVIYSTLYPPNYNIVDFNYGILFLSMIITVISLTWGYIYFEYICEYLTRKELQQYAYRHIVEGHFTGGDSYKSRIEGKTKPTRIFKINEYITLKLENDNTHIYVNDKIFLQCKYLLLNISPEQLKEYNKIIKSIDDVAELLDHSLEGSFHRNWIISPEQGFMAHCSNIQAWVECDYDTRILHSNMSFPLLKKLVEVGDIKAKKVFKEEIAKRFIEGNKNTRFILSDKGYLNYLDIEEIVTILRIVLEKDGKISLNIDLSKRIGLINDSFTRIVVPKPKKYDNLGTFTQYSKID